MTNIISFRELLLISKTRKTDSYFYKLRNKENCFTGQPEVDFKQANLIIDKTLNDSTAHSYAAAFR
jgi:hypothetical protein